MALITLFRCCTGEDWNDIMMELSGPSNNANPYVAMIYFISFLVLSSNIILNLFVMILIDNFDQVFSTAEAEGMDEEQLNQFKVTWSVLDPQATGFIPAHRIEVLLKELMPPLGLGPGASFEEVLTFSKRFHTQAYMGMVEYRALLLAIHEITYGKNVSERIKDMLVQHHSELKRYKKLRLVTQKVGGENGAPVQYKRKSVILKREMTHIVNGKFGQGNKKMSKRMMRLANGAVCCKPKEKDDDTDSDDDDETYVKKRKPSKWKLVLQHPRFSLMVENNRSSLIHEIGAFKLQQFWVGTRKRRQWQRVIKQGLRATLTPADVPKERGVDGETHAATEAAVPLAPT